MAVLDQRIKARARRSNPGQRPRVQRLPSRSRMSLPRPKMLLPARQ